MRSFFSFHDPRNSTGSVSTNLRAFQEQRLRVTSTVDIFLFTGTEADDHLFVVKQAKQAGHPDRRPAQPLSRDFSGDTVLPLAPAFRQSESESTLPVSE